MEFFIPAAADAEQAESVLKGTRDFALQNLGWTITNRRIYRIKYKHNGKIYTAVVGEKDQVENEIVICILESITFLVCTANRGVVRGEPILVGKEEILEIEDFK